MNITLFTFSPIGYIYSPYKEKFAIPRQPRLIKDGGGTLVCLNEYSQHEAFRQLSQFSHLWLLSVFHETIQSPWHPTVRPPRLGGNERVGVFASRSPFRPNAIGLSLVELLQIEYQAKHVILHLGSLDLLDNTPILDIKPYLPFSDSIPSARAGYAQQTPEPLAQIIFSDSAELALKQYGDNYPHLRRFISQVLLQDPRPAYHKKQLNKREYHVHLLEFNIHWRVIADLVEVLAIDPISSI